MLSQKKVKAMKREDQIRLEFEKASQLGFKPRAPISRDERFRVRRTSPCLVAADSSLLPTRSEANHNDNDFQAGVTNSQIIRSSPAVRSIVSKQAASAKSVRARILSELKKANDENLELVLPRLLQQVNILAASNRDNKLVKSLQRSISRAVFGPEKMLDLKRKYGGGRFKNK